MGCRQVCREILLLSERMHNPENLEIMETSVLLKKYNVAAPRYTSYPTVPYWDNKHFNEKDWSNTLAKTYATYKKERISLYIHVPFCENLCTYCGCNTRITKNHSIELPYFFRFFDFSAGNRVIPLQHL
jgi:hypothetical protein